MVGDLEPSTAHECEQRGASADQLSLRACADHLHALPERVIILSITDLPTPRVRPADRFEIDHLGRKDDGITFVRAKHGYAEHYNVPALVRQLAKAGAEGPLDTHDMSFYVSEVDLRVGREPGMRRWRKRLVLATALLAAEPADYLGLPRSRTVTLGSEIEF